MFVKTMSSQVYLTAFAAAATLLWAGGAMGADSARAAYEQQRAVCESGASGQDRATCLREAGAALQEARRGQLTRGVDEQQLRANAAQRCERLPAERRSECMALRSSDARVQGSVEGGGIMRSITIREVGEPAPHTDAAPAPTMTPPATTTTPRPDTPAPAPAPSGAGTGLRY